MKRISVTIEESQLNWLEDEVRKGVFSSISHGVRYALKKLVEEVPSHE